MMSILPPAEHIAAEDHDEDHDDADDAEHCGLPACLIQPQCARLRVKKG